MNLGALCRWLGRCAGAYCGDNTMGRVGRSSNAVTPTNKHK
jgi:hypothetical protein